MPLLRAPCLLTGATGFLGTELVRRLLAGGVAPEHLRCLVRDPAAALARGIPAASIRRGELADAAAVRAAVDGAGSVVHLAGTVKAARASDYFVVNRDGTRNLVDAVAAVGAPGAFFVQVSSLAAAGPSIDGLGTDRPPAQCQTVSAYGESKRQAELLVVAAVRRWAIVRPPVVYGSGDAATRLLFRQALAPVCAVPLRARPLSVVHVADVASAILAALERQPEGAVLPLDGPERTDTHALLRAIAAACHRHARLLPVPLGVAAVAAGCSDLLARLTGRSSFFNGDKVRELAAAGWVADAACTRRLLAWAPRTRLLDGLRDVAHQDGRVAAGSAAGPAR